LPDEVYEKVRPFFSEKDLVDLTLAIVLINGWNRLNNALRTVPGTYQPARRASLRNPRERGPHQLRRMIARTEQGVRGSMECFICTQCGTQYSESDQPPYKLHHLQ
jgi:hypothetical protein